MVYSLMGEKNFYQPLTREDRISVVLYRTGIVLSALTVLMAALIAFKPIGGSLRDHPLVASGMMTGILILLLHFSVGLSVFFIHLYVGKFHRILKKIYYISVLCLAALFFIGKGNLTSALTGNPPLACLLLIPVSLCLGFVTAKEAFCFKLFEGYLLAIIMPAYLLFYSIGLSTSHGTMTGLLIVAFLLLFFTVRKVTMPIHFDIGDKSAYQP